MSRICDVTNVVNMLLIGEAFGSQRRLAHLAALGLDSMMLQ